jgi:hypothetical protein
MDSMSHDERMEAAIADLKSQKSTNYAAAAREWKLEPTTLRRRFIGASTSIEEANSNSRQYLTSSRLRDGKKKVVTLQAA